MKTDLNILTEQWTNNSFSVRSIVKIIKGPHELSTSYETTCPSFTFTIRGSGELRLNKHAYELKPGKVIHSCTGMWLKAWNTGEDEFECYRVLYLPEPREISMDNYMYRHFELAIGYNPQIFSTLGKMNSISNQGDIQSEFQVKILFYDLLGKMFAAGRSLVTNEHRTIVEESMAYIHLHFQEQHSLFSLASRYQLSPKYFAEIFYKDAGISPINYLIHYRMKFAEKLLLTTSASIREIGRSVGYADPYQFSKMFKKHMGVAPSAFKSSALSQLG